MQGTKAVTRWQSLLIRVAAALALAAGFVAIGCYHTEAGGSDGLHGQLAWLYGATFLVVIWIYAVAFFFGGRPALESMFPYNNLPALMAYYRLFPLLGYRLVLLPCFCDGVD